MLNKFEGNKYGRFIGRRGQSWVYLKVMMRLADDEKNALEYAAAENTLAANPSANKR